MPYGGFAPVKPFGQQRVSMIGSGRPAIHSELSFAFVSGAVAWTTGSGIFNALLVVATVFVATWLIAFVVRPVSLAFEFYHFKKERPVNTRRTYLHLILDRALRR